MTHLSSSPQVNSTSPTYPADRCKKPEVATIANSSPEIATFTFVLLLSCLFKTSSSTPSPEGNQSFSQIYIRCSQMSLPLPYSMPLPKPINRPATPPIFPSSCPQSEELRHVCIHFISQQMRRVELYRTNKITYCICPLQTTYCVQLLNNLQ